MSQPGENTSKISAKEVALLSGDNSFPLSPLVILYHIGSPIITRMPVKKTWSLRFELEWAEILNWGDVPCSREMFAVFFNGRPKSARYRREVSKSLAEFDARWYTNNRSDQHRGETVEEFLARGGQIKTCPPCETDLSEHPYWVDWTLAIDRRPDQNQQPLKTDSEF